MTIEEINQQISKKNRGWAKYLYTRYCLPSMKEGLSTSYIYDQLVAEGLQLKKAYFIDIISRFRRKPKRQEIKKIKPSLVIPNQNDRVIVEENIYDATESIAPEFIENNYDIYDAIESIPSELKADTTTGNPVSQISGISRFREDGTKRTLNEMIAEKRKAERNGW
jgi:hypothetical protein